MVDGAEMSILEKLLSIQHDLKVDKANFNKHGKFNYRTKEDILEAAKPLAYDLGCLILCEDIPVQYDVEGEPWIYMKTTATLLDVKTGETFSRDGWSREPRQSPAMNESQTTGSAASYSGKRALGNLFSIDDTKDADQIEPKSQQLVGACMACGTRYIFSTEEQMHDGSMACNCGNTKFHCVP